MPARNRTPERAKRLIKISYSSRLTLKVTASYDSIAGLYRELWADWYLPAALPALEKLFFSRVRTGLKVLDACCGCGHITRELVKRGYNVTGVDISAELISIARKDVPQAEFMVADITAFDTDRQFHAAISTFDALNHILRIEDLSQALRSVRRSLVSGGLFVFDVNLEEAYLVDLRNWHPTVKESDVSLMRGAFDLNTRIARTDLIWFIETDQPPMWERRTATVNEKAYSEAEIVNALEATGWSKIERQTAREAGVDAELGFGRVFFSARA